MEVSIDEKMNESKAYLATHKISEIVQALTQGLLVDKPGM
jgi:hypothetical protein